MKGMDWEESLWKDISCWLWYHVEFNRDRRGRMVFLFFCCVCCVQSLSIYNTAVSKSLLLIYYTKLKSRIWRCKSRHLTEPKIKVRDCCYVFSACWGLAWFLVRCCIIFYVINGSQFNMIYSFNFGDEIEIYRPFSLLF
jgi:hypothetical protein